MGRTVLKRAVFSEQCTGIGFFEKNSFDVIAAKLVISNSSPLNASHD